MAERAVKTAKTSEAKQRCSNSCKQNMGFHSSGSAADIILQLQRTAGNRAVQKLIKSGALQAKLRIGQPNDLYEQEADRAVEQVMRVTDSVIQLKQNNSLRRNQSRTNETTAGSTAPDIAVMYQYTVEGKTFRLTEAEFSLERARVNKKLELDFKLLEEEVIFNKQQHQEFLDKIHGWAGIVSDILGDTVPPHIGIWSWPISPIINGRKALQFGNLKLAGRQLKLAQDTFREAQREWNTYVDKTSGGAQKAITTLEYTRDVSFSIAIGTAAVVAAPAVAGALAGGGTITAGAVLGSGAIVTTGGGITGAALRGGSSAAGQALTGGPISGTEVWKEMKAGAKSGTVDAASSVVGFGAGKALGLGTKGVSLGGKLIRGGLAGGASGATGGALGSTLEGKSASEILEDTGKGAFSGMAGGAIGSAASHISTGRSTISKYVIETLGEVGSGAASAAVTGGSLEDIKKAAITSVVSGMATSAATHPGPKITRGTESALELDPGTQPASPSVSNPVKTPAFTKEPEPFKVSHEAAPPKAASSKGNESHTVKSKLPEPIKTEIPPPKKKSNRSKSAKSKREAEYLKEKKQLSQQAIEEGAIERESRIDERSEKAKRKSRDIERRQARLREQGQNEAEQSPTPKFDFTDAEFNEGFSLVAEKPGVQVPVNKTGDPAKVLEVGAGLKQTDLGLPPNEELVNVTQSDKNPSRSNVMELDAEKPLPPEMNGEYDSIMINNPRRYVPNIEKLGKALKPGGRIIVQGKGEVFKGMRGANPDFEKVLKMPAPLGYKKIIDLSPSGSAPITPDQILGGPFYSTTGEPIGWPNGRVIFGKLPEGPFAKEAITATGKTKVLASGTEVTGEGKALAEGGKAAAAYDDIDLTSLRQAARTDPEAVEALRLRYKNMSDFELFQRFADDADETAAAIIRQKFPSNEAALKKILGKDYRPPHSATAVLRRGGRVVRYEKLESGHVADLPAEERALGFPRNRLATHTERWAIRRIDLHPGDSLEIRGQYDPCDSCIKAMSEAATRTRATIKYWWQGGSMTFFPN